MQGTYHRISPFLLLHLSGQRLPQPSPPDVHKHKAAEYTVGSSQFTADPDNTTVCAMVLLDLNIRYPFLHSPV